MHNGDRVGLLMVSDRIEVELAPAGGIRHLSQIVRALVATPATSLKTQSKRSNSASLRRRASSWAVFLPCTHDWKKTGDLRRVRAI